MSLIVLDASAAVEMFLGTPEGRSLSTKVPKGSTTHVPEHFYVEVAATLRRMELGGAITPRRRRQGLPEAAGPHNPPGPGPTAATRRLEAPAQPDDR